MQASLTATRPQGLFSTRAAPSRRCSHKLVVMAQPRPEDRSLPEKLALPAAAVMAAALLFTATPDAAEAARSGGRVGGRSGFSSRSGPSSSRARVAPGPSSSRTRIQNNYYSAPPLVGGYGYGMPFFGGGFGLPLFGGGFGVYPVFGVGLGTLFNLMILGIVINVVVNVVKNFTNSPGSRGRSDDSFDDDRW